jgi:formate hydrogenlyase transcriptional activator
MPDESTGHGDEKAARSDQAQVFDELLAAYASTAGIAILDSEYRYVWVNQQLAALNGVQPSEHLGKTVREVIGQIADEIEPYLQRVFSTGRSIWNVEISGAHSAQKKTVHRRQHFFPIKVEANQVVRVGVVVTEIRDAKKLQKEIEDRDRRLRIETNRLEALTEINTLLSSNWDVPQVFPAVSARIRRVLRQEMAGFVGYNAETNEFVQHALDFPLSKGFIAQSPLSAIDSPVQQALNRATSLIFSRKELETFQSSMARSLMAEGVQSLCCVPMMRPKGPLGVLVLGSTRPDAFQTDDLNLLTQVANQLALALENHLAASEIKVLRERLSEERKYLEGEIEYEGHFAEIVGNSSALRQVLQQVITVANSSATVLILGETGTGKELVARATHRLGRQKDGPFTKLNCAAIPTGLLESELFGHEKGAFTGAISQKIGRLELAEGGTLFLDEVGEIPLELQPKLLRVLQDQEFERLGSNRTIKVNVRLVAATNRNLAERIAQNQFRSDLYYRLSVFPIVLPPLRERKEDIPLLVRHFVRQFAERMDRHIESIPHATMDALQAWPWPGNVRELENLMERSVILSQGEVLRVPLWELRAQTSLPEPVHDQSLDSAERQHILRVLRETKGKISGPGGAATRLGLKRTTLQSKMDRLKIKRQDYIDAKPD